MGDGTEPPPRLDQRTLQRFSVEVGQCTTRADLNALTRAIWRSYDSVGNGVALDQLKARIKAQREIIARNDPR